MSSTLRKLNVSPVTVVDHRRIKGFGPPPRTYVERFRSGHERESYVRTILQIPARVEPDGRGAFHVYEREG